MAARESDSIILKLMRMRELEDCSCFGFTHSVMGANSLFHVASAYRKWEVTLGAMFIAVLQKLWHDLKE